MCADVDLCCFADINSSIYSSQKEDGNLDLTFRMVSDSEADYNSTNSIYLNAMNSLFERYNMKFSRTAFDKRYFTFVREAYPDLFWIAHCKEEPVGFLAGVDWKEQQHIGALFVEPDFQGQGIGASLLRRHLSNTRGGMITSLATPAINTGAQGLYIRSGLLPRSMLYTVTVEKNNHSSKFVNDSERCFHKTLYKAGSEEIRQVSKIPMELDDSCLGSKRKEEHLFLQGHKDLLILRDKKRNNAGYCYLDTSGQLGPAVGKGSKPTLELVSEAMRILFEEGKTPSFIIPNENVNALSIISGLGGVVLHHSILFASAPFGELRHYLSGGPSLL